MKATTFEVLTEGEVERITPPLSDPLPAQPQAAINTIRIFIGLIPAALLVLAILFDWRYPITRESHQATLRELSGSDE